MTNLCFGITFSMSTYVWHHRSNADYSWYYMFNANLCFGIKFPMLNHVQYCISNAKPCSAFIFQCQMKFGIQFLTPRYALYCFANVAVCVTPTFKLQLLFSITCSLLSCVLFYIHVSMLTCGWHCISNAKPCFALIFKIKSHLAFDF